MSLFLLAILALVLHFRIHNFMVAPHDASGPEFDSTHFLAFLFPLVDVIGVTALFASKRTAVYGYLLNGMIVVFGTVLMAHFSIAELTTMSAPLLDWLTSSILPGVGIAWVDFFIGKALYGLYVKV